MRKGELNSYLSFAKKLINVSEKIVKKNTPTKIKVNFKIDQSPVTKVDMQVERSLRKLISQKYPEHGIYGEEYQNKNLQSEFIWVIDPIDGTKNFINGNGNYGTLLALCHKGAPIIGIINSPELKKRWIGIKNHGAYCNNKKLKKASSDQSLKELFFSTSGMTAFQDSIKNKKYKSLAKNTQYISFGGDCVQYGLLAEKRIPLVVESYLKPFDYLPLVNIIEETGGIITDWQGKTLNFNSNGDVVASISAKAHKQFLKL